MRPPLFLSLRFAPTGVDRREAARYPAVTVTDSRTGAIIRRLLPGNSDGMHVTGLSLDRAGNMWVTYSRGPAYRSNGLGGDPRPGSCANQIDVWHRATGRITVFLRTGGNVLISGSAISPDGRMLAYGESGCATGYFNTWLRVTALGTGRSWTIGQHLLRCHLITNPSWSADSGALLVAYAPHAGPAYTGPQGSCGGVGRERLVRLNADAGQAGLSGTAAAADPGCQITSAAGTAYGALAVEACGSRGYLAGPARLLVLDTRLRLVHRLALGRCTDGNELAADRSGHRTLISVYLYCNPPGRPGPVTRVWTYYRGTLRPVTTIAGGNLSISFMTW